MTAKAGRDGWSPWASFLTLVVLGLVPLVYLLLLIVIAGVTVASVALVAALGYYLVYQRHLIRLTVPIAFLALFMGVAVLNIVRAAIRSFFGEPHFETAVWINMDREPRLRQFIEGICHGVGSKVPDAVVLHLAPTFFVMQGELTVLNATPRGRILAISLPLLGVLKVGELRAILAHEFAHFTGRDTLYSSLAMRVYMSAGDSAFMLFSMWMFSGWILKLLTALALLPAAAVLYAYTWFFHLINMSLSRTREFRADRIATMLAGRKYMHSGLKKTCGYSEVVGPLMHDKIVESVQQREPRDSPFRLMRKSIAQHSSAAAQAAEKYIAEEASAMADSHPTVRNRLAALPDTPGVEVPGLDQHALTLFTQLKQYEKIAGDYVANEYHIRERQRLSADPTPHLR